MNRPLWKWLFAISLALNAGILATVAWHTFQAPTAASRERQPDLPEKLQLNQEQRDRWQHAEQRFLRDLSVNWQQIRQHRETLVRLIFSAVPERAAIDAAQKKIAALQDAQQRLVIEQLLAEREMLDARQRQALMDLLLARYAQEVTQEERLHRH